ncbi:MAG: hypothetical protein ACR2QM_00330 [Longimicrobiales bacterium]
MSRTKAVGPRGTERPEQPCPFCDGRRTELMSLFGSHASLSTFWCKACRSPFEVLRWQAKKTGS